jgi:hypothetical protein
MPLIFPDPFLTRSWSNGKKNALVLLACAVAVIVFSGYRAYRIAEEQEKLRDFAPPPFFDVRFALHPNRLIVDAPPLGFKPGWVVIFAPRFKGYGTAYFISPFGTLLAMGTPSIVAARRQQAEDSLDKFKLGFGRLDAAIRVGMPFRNVTTLLKIKPAILTNDDGTMDVYYQFTPRAQEFTKIDWLTNGITLHVSNGIVTRKDYSYMSQR